MNAEEQEVELKKRRTKPLTAIGIRRLKCFRRGCDNQAATQWTICSDGNVFRPLCLACDVELNTLVLRWVGFADWEDKIEAYKKHLQEGYDTGKQN